jgi:hypothetical protein
VASGGADRIEQDLTWADVAAPMIDPDEDSGVEDALLAYAHRKAARTGAEWFAAEWQRRDEAEGEDAARPVEPVPASTFATTLRPIPKHDEGVVDAEVEANVVNEGPAGLGLRPEQPRPAVVAPPAAEPVAQPVPEPAPEPAPAPVVAAPPVVPPHVVAAPVVTTPAPATFVEPAPIPAPLAVRLAEAAPPVNPETATPPLRHPTVPRPPVVEEPEPTSRKERRRHKRKREHEEPVATTPPMFTAGEWARMSPGARRLYGMENTPPS